MRTLADKKGRFRPLEKAVKMSFSNMIALPASLLKALPRTARTPFLPWGVKHIGAPKAWKYAKGESVHIAVIDTGADYSHQDLRHSLGEGYNALHPHLPPHDDNGHGTHITGTIAARNEWSGMTGVAPRAVIHPVKAFDHSGSAYIADIVSGIEWCIRKRMHIINMSFGMRHNSAAVREAVHKARKAGIVIIASAGNDGKIAADYPARYPGVICVGAATHKNGKLKMSNRGRHIHLYAPGEHVISTWPNGGYHTLSGTSMAAAYVTGAAALLLSYRPRLTANKVKRLLLESALPAQRSAQMKAGILNVSRALRKLWSHKRYMRSGAETPIKRRTLRRTVRTQPARARRA